MAAITGSRGGHAAADCSPCITTDGRLQMLRTFLATIALAAPAITVAPLPSHAQSNYPNRMVKIVVPYGAGTVPDIFARALTTGLSGRLGQQFIVENKVGGSGALGTASVVRAGADGYAVLFAPALVLSVLPQSRNDRLQARLARPSLPDLRQHDGGCSAAGFADQKHRRLGRNSEAKARRAELRSSRRHDHTASRDGGVHASRCD